MDTPAYARTLLISDAAINIKPEFEDKIHIVQNAIDLAHALGIPEPKVALLSAVETVNPKIPSTMEAAALCKMADRGQITGGILDGPLAFDTAVSAHAAEIKHLNSPVTGQADILIVPDLESGNMLAKQLEYLGGAQLAGIVLGARVPVILTSRADSAETRLTSCAVAMPPPLRNASRRDRIAFQPLLKQEGRQFQTEPAPFLRSIKLATHMGPSTPIADDTTRKPKISPTFTALSFRWVTWRFCIIPEVLRDPRAFDRHRGGSHLPTPPHHRAYGSVHGGSRS